ncbi:Zn-dependent protease with chaperone function [Granulicella rosea]|uniref:Zn-dependent protease with chaperone function n=1 Tax=Granulicella rosea TaxID=474952 RepID=A0A239D6I3_9BACT|nr:M48 family metallopeptidase [Granulicella rosea]SNS27762.1 Zn-dependent protease with chaperone function [Granulicella rosea]
MRRRLNLALALLLAILAAPHLAHALQTAAPQHPPYYTLPPDKLLKAKALSHDFNIIHFAYEGWSIVCWLLLLGLGAVARLRDRAVRLTGIYWFQGPALLAMLLAVRTVLNLPIAIYAHHLTLVYGLSVQGWASWAGDVGKSLGVNIVLDSLIAAVLFWCIRRWPRRWWLAFWIALVPIVFTGAFAAPLVIDPLFNHFEPLQTVAPQLADSLQAVIRRAGVDIPPSHMFVMRASDKYTTLNAYVTGLGASKRVVVWDTTLKAPTDIVQITFAHELGHYVLHHVLRGIALALPGLLLAFYLAYRILHWLLARYGGRWRIASQQDWGAIAVLLLLLSAGTFLTEPIANTISRGVEHDADVFGQEAVHGIVPDPQATAVRSFQILGEASLDDPDPSPFVEFWTDTHPSTTHRAEFAAHYNPWAAGADPHQPGQQPKYFKK